MNEGWCLHSYLQDVQFILGKKHIHFKIPSHSLFNAAPFQLPRQSQHPHRRLEISTFSLYHDNSSHERTSLSFHIPSVHLCTLSSGLCIHYKAPWIYLKKDGECCILDNVFGLLVLHISSYMLFVLEFTRTCIGIVGICICQINMVN